MQPLTRPGEHPKRANSDFEFWSEIVIFAKEMISLPGEFLEIFFVRFAYGVLGLLKKVTVELALEPP